MIYYKFNNSIMHGYVVHYRCVYKKRKYMYVPQYKGWFKDNHPIPNINVYIEIPRKYLKLNNIPEFTLDMAQEL